jgi:SagB-type dehydrogenase family enzyme
VRFSACVLVFAGVFDRITAKFGERGVGFVHMEAAHAAQNVQLQATALHVGSVMIGSFKKDEIHRILGLPEGEEAVYLMAVGKV